VSEATAPLVVAGNGLSRNRLLPRRQTELDRLAGFLVVDLHGRVVGRVEGPAFAAANGTPATISVSFGFLWLRRCVVAVESIERVDGGLRVVGLRVGRKALRTGRA
jgi:hypothetical protein